MVDPNGMTILDGIQNLQEGMLGQLIVAHEPALLGDIGEQVTLGTELNHDESAIRAVQNADQRHNIGVLAGLVVQRDLSSLKASLSGIQSDLWQGLDRKWDMGQDVDGLVNDSISTDSKDRNKFQSSG